jgi:ABC-type branched-subunit amino acid transport system substrate-binding protein
MKNHLVVALGSTAALLLAACGSDSNAGTNTAAPPATVPPAPVATQPASTAPATTAPQPPRPRQWHRRPASPVRRPASPIKIGFVNLEGGAISLPELRIGAQTAADYVNAHGGANGRPLQIIPCNVDGTPEKSIDCANQLIGQGVSLMFEGYDPSSDAMLPVLDSAGVALTGHAAFGPQQQASDNAYFFGTANPSFTAGFLDYYAKAGAKSVMMFLPDNPAFRDSAKTIIEPVSKMLGLDTTTTFYDASVNWESLATTALAANPDVVGTVAPDPDCLGLLAPFAASDTAGMSSSARAHCSLSPLRTRQGCRPRPPTCGSPPIWRAAGRQEGTAPAVPRHDDRSGTRRHRQRVRLGLLLRHREPGEDPVDHRRRRHPAGGEGRLQARRSTRQLHGTEDLVRSQRMAGPVGVRNQVLLYQVQDDGTQKAVTPNFIDTSGFIGELG